MQSSQLRSISYSKPREHGIPSSYTSLIGSDRNAHITLFPEVVDALKAAVGVKYRQPSILVFISSLISLMENQVAHFSAIRIPSIATKGRDNLQTTCV